MMCSLAAYSMWPGIANITNIQRCFGTMITLQNILQSPSQREMMLDDIFSWILLDAA